MLTDILKFKFQQTFKFKSGPMLNQVSRRDQHDQDISVNQGQNECKGTPSQKNTYNLSYTPVSKNQHAFKSPAPSNKKCLNVNNNRSPFNNTQGRINFSNSKLNTSNIENWMISPVCSRLREHIQMLNGNSQKERLFLNSPMTNQMAWPIASPAINT